MALLFIILGIVFVMAIVGAFFVKPDGRSGPWNY